MTNQEVKRHIALRQAAEKWAERTGRTYGDLADAVGVDRSHISHILSGRRECPVGLGMALSLETGIPVEKWLNPHGRHLVRAFLAAAREQVAA